MEPSRSKQKDPCYGIFTNIYHEKKQLNLDINLAKQSYFTNLPTYLPGFCKITPKFTNPSVFHPGNEKTYPTKREMPWNRGICERSLPQKSSYPYNPCMVYNIYIYIYLHVWYIIYVTIMLLPWRVNRTLNHEIICEFMMVSHRYHQMSNNFLQSIYSRILKGVPGEP